MISNSTHLPNIPPYNTFSLTCTATAPEGVVSPKTFTWWRQNAVMNSKLVQINHSETNYINGSTLNQPKSTSVLTVTETTAGEWYYHCNVTLEELTNVSNKAGSHLIQVTGKSLYLLQYFLIFIDLTDQHQYHLYICLYRTNVSSATCCSSNLQCHNSLSHCLLDCTHHSLHP